MYVCICVCMYVYICVWPSRSIGVRGAQLPLKLNVLLKKYSTQNTRVYSFCENHGYFHGYFEIAVKKNNRVTAILSVLPKGFSNDFHPDIARRFHTHTKT